MSEMTTCARTECNRRNIAKLVGAYVGGVLSIVFALVIAHLPLLVPLAALVVLGCSGWYLYRYVDRFVLASLGGAAADPDRHARLHNLTDGLCIAAGVERPELYVVADDSANLCSVARDTRHSAIVVTSGLLDALDRIELEGVLAHELAHIKNLDARLATLLCLAPIARGMLGAHRESLADLAAVELTRYPPGLIGGLEKMRERGTHVARAPKWTWHLWMEPVSSASAQARARTELSIDDRIAALREL
ncbi:MAG: M48 family metalloprotease [Acidimicrobiales bacterium]|nr:M48 family metalloprotease [Acidimicrobiales bacterium]